MNILYTSRDILERFEYRTFMPDASGDSFYFEDESVMGMVTEYLSVELLLAEWERRQDHFLREYGGQVRAAALKAWNVYTIHLTQDAETTIAASELFAVEENFRGTRKIARTAVTDTDAVRTALLPLLPIHNQVILTTEDVMARVSERLAASHVALTGLMNHATSVESLAALLIEDVS